jgi:hypothetical protein
MSDLPLNELENELASLASNLSAGMCRLLEIVGEVDRREAWTGWSSCAAWLAWRCALSPRSAREHVRVARDLPELPLIRASFACGELSYAKVRALTRVATAETEAELLDFAAVLTAAQLERALRAYARVSTREAHELQKWERLTYFWDDDGNLIVRGRLAPEDGALFIRALEAAREQLWKANDDWWKEDEGGSAEPRHRPPSNAEAFVTMADNALARNGESRGGGDRYAVVVHVEEAALRQGGEGSCLLEDGPALAAETARRLACDASVRTLYERNSAILDLGRKTRQISFRLRQALKTRDQGCRFPGCTNTRHLHAHHIKHWARGGATNRDNLILLCTRHHRLVHEGGYSVDEHHRFHDPWGRPIPAAPRPPRGSPATLRQGNRRRGGEIKRCNNGSGDPMELDLAVDEIFQILRQPP